MFRLTQAVREYFRYTGISADIEKRGLGSSRARFAWANRTKASGAAQHEGENALVAETESSPQGGASEADRTVAANPARRR